MFTKEIMSQNIIHVTPDQSVLEAWDLMLANQIRHLVVMENKKVVGIVSDRDFLKVMSTLQKISIGETPISYQPHKIKDIMTWPVFTVKDETPIEDVIEEVLLQKVSAFIVENKKHEIKGIVTTEDFLIYLYKLIRIDKKKSKDTFSTFFQSNELY